MDDEKIDETVLALLYLGRHSTNREEHVRTWKTFDWTVMERLDAKGFISNPVGKAKSVVFSNEGLEQVRRLFEELFEPVTDS